MNITFPLGSASENAPTKGASMIKENTKNCCNTGICQEGAVKFLSKAMAAKRSTLSASDEKNCAERIM